MSIYKIILAFIILLQTQTIAGQHFIDSNTVYLKGNSNIFVKPGDTIYLLAGSKSYLLLENLHGNADSNIVIINKNGKVEINTNHYFGISTKNCTYFKISGNGSPNIKYGIDISRVQNGAGIGISGLSNHFELENIRISNTALAGIYAKSDPDTSFQGTRDKFLMKGIKIHDLLIEDVSDEGMYIGSTKYFGQNVSYQGADTLVFPHLISDISIYQNIIINSGWDGIQLSSASEKSSIFSNIILNDSYKKYHNQMSGIMLGGGTKADCYNNFIADGNGTGIVVLGLGGQKIFNNIIINAGSDFFPNDLTKMQHGIYVDDGSVIPDSSFNLFNNLIINAKSDGIRFRSLLSKNNLIANNIIINPGNYGYYDTLGTSYNAEDAYIMITDTNVDVDILANSKALFYKNFNFIDSTNFNFCLASNSPLIDMGINLDFLGYEFDFYNNLRNKGLNWDIGPFEFDTQLVEIQKIKTGMKEWEVYPNPANFELNIKSTKDFKNGKYQIMNDLGDIIQFGEFNIENKLDVSELSAGLYFIIILNDRNEIKSKKFIKN